MPAYAPSRNLGEAVRKFNKRSERVDRWLCNFRIWLGRRIHYYISESYNVYPIYGVGLCLAKTTDYPGDVRHVPKTELQLSFGKVTKHFGRVYPELVKTEPIATPNLGNPPVIKDAFGPGRHAFPLNVTVGAKPVKWGKREKIDSKGKVVTEHYVLPD
jgi:hypothetical protein